MHAFIPALCAHDLERKIIVGGVYIISFFIVQAYLKTDKYRCVRAPNQLLFSKDTKIVQVDETRSKIATEHFDFYDHSELRALADQTTYMIGLHSIQSNSQCYSIFKFLFVYKKFYIQMLLE